MGKITFRQEEDNLIHTILDKRFFSIWRNPSASSLWNMTNLELYITSTCNLGCKYCYLNERGDKLYPKEYRDENNIKENLVKILEWWMMNDFSIKQLQLFSGEIWHLPFGRDILEIILSYVKKGMKLGGIMIPTNSTFVLEEDNLNKMQNLIDQFKETKCSLIISHSIEGLVLEDISRPMKTTNKTRDEKFYENVFTFAKKNGFLFHPMVAAANIEKWIENFDWYESMCKKYDMPFPSSVMMLEVRNSDWSDDKLEYLKKYYKYQIDRIWKMSEGNYDKFAAKAFNMGGGDAMGYVNFAFPMAKTQAGCTITTDLTVRLGDLSIMPCHRTSYSQFAYGKFKINNDVIVGIEAVNPQMATKILFSNHLTSMHGCDVCAYKGVCMRQCFGEQYEATEEIFMPDPNVCKMFKTKYNFLIDTYDEMGVLKFLAEIPTTDTRYVVAQQMLIEIDKINSCRRG